MRRSALSVAIRPGRDEDAASFIALIGACWAQYPGIMLDVDGEMPELRALASYYNREGGALWVAEADGTIAGRSVRVGQIADGMVEILAGLSPGEKVVTSGALFIDRAASSD